PGRPGGLRVVERPGALPAAGDAEPRRRPVAALAGAAAERHAQRPEPGDRTAGMAGPAPGARRLDPGASRRRDRQVLGARMRRAHDLRPAAVPLLPLRE